MARDLGQAFGEALALRIDQSGGARAGERVNGALVDPEGESLAKCVAEIAGQTEFRVAAE